METSRDDFVIAIRSAFLKKGTQQRFSLLGLMIFSIIFLILGNFNFKPINYLKIAIKEITYSVSFIASLPENALENIYLAVQNQNNLYVKNKKIKSELEDMKSENISKNIIEFENIRLKQIIDDYFINDKEIFAKVLIDKKSPFLRSIIINKGSKNNIELGMAVLDDKYFIGKVVEVNYTTSRVLLISDLNSKIPVSLEPNNMQAIMSGDGNKNGIIEYASEGDLENDSTDLTVFTSGMGGLFKSGLPVGKIIKKKNFSNIESIVIFYKDLSQLKYVKIISFKKENLNLEIKKKEANSKVSKKNEILEFQSESVSLLKKQKEISEEIRLKLEDENNSLNMQLLKLKKEISIIKNDKTEDNELKFLELNLLYGDKCKKTFYNNLYKIGTIKYRNCVLRKGRN